MSKQRSKEQQQLVEYNTVLVDGRHIRHVQPYIQAFNTFAKGRWIGREIIEVLTREFGGHPEAYWRNAVSQGHVLVNGKVVSGEYRFKNSDSFLHRTHRYL